MNPGLFSANTDTWGTPKDVFDALDKEFTFDLDPCPGEATLRAAGMRVLKNGLEDRWAPFTTAFVNPPYGRAIAAWIAKAVVASHNGRVVLLIPARTDTGWWHDLILPFAKEIRFIRGRLGFTGITPKLEKGHTTLRSRAPFPSVVVVL